MQKKMTGKKPGMHKMSGTGMMMKDSEMRYMMGEKPKRKGSMKKGK